MKLKRLCFLSLIRVIGFCIASVLFGVLCLRWALSGFASEFWTPKKRISPPACLTSPQYGRHQYIQLKNVRLHYVENGDKKKPLMLLLHGFPEFWYSWKHQLKAFAKTHWVVAVDMRGYGESEKPKGCDNYTIPILVDDVRQLIEALGKETCVLVTHDWGGIIGWIFAALYPNMLTHHIALNIPHPVTFVEHLTTSPRQFLYSWYVYYFQVPYLSEMILSAMDNRICEKIGPIGLPPGQDRTEEIEAFKYHFSQPGAWSGPLSYYRNIFAASSPMWQKDSSKKLRVRVPTLLIFGKKDIALDYRMAHMSADHVDNYQCKLIPDSNHWVQREKPDEVNQYIAEFLGITLK